MALTPRYIWKKLRRRSTRDYKYHQRHRRETEVILKSIESLHGKISAKTTQQCDDYATEVFGSKVYAPWLYVYSTFAGTFKEGWIPDNYYGKHVIPAIQSNYKLLSTLKALTGKLFNSRHFPDLAYQTSGLFFDTTMQVISPNQLEDAIFSDSDRVIYKEEMSGRGIGIHWFNRDDFDINAVQLLPPGVFQAPIQQHSFFSDFTPYSTATIRIMTTVDNSGNSQVRGAYLRTGRDTDTHVKSSSQIMAAIDSQSGDIGEIGYLSDWTPVVSHPDTQVPFKGKTIPHFDRCVSTAIELQKQIPFVRCVGWDLVVDVNDEVKLMEFNSGHNGIKILEAYYGPCFADLGWEKLWKK